MLYSEGVKPGDFFFPFFIKPHYELVKSHDLKMCLTKNEAKKMIVYPPCDTCF